MLDDMKDFLINLFEGILIYAIVGIVFFGIACGICYGIHNYEVSHYYYEFDTGSTKGIADICWNSIYGGRKSCSIGNKEFYVNEYEKIKK